MNKEQLINEIQKEMIDKSYHGDYSTIYEFLCYIDDTTVLGDILSELKSN